MSAGFTPWRRGSHINSWDRLNERLGDLEFLLGEFFRAVFGGPVPGSYFPVSIHRPGAVAAGTGVWRVQIPFELRPILVSVAVRSGSGEITIDINDDGASILAAPLATSSGLVSVRSRSSFSTQKVSSFSTVSLDIDAIAGSPSDLVVLMVFKETGKIEPA